MVIMAKESEWKWDGECEVEVKMGALIYAAVIDNARCSFLRWNDGGMGGWALFARYS